MATTTPTEETRLPSPAPPRCLACRAFRKVLVVQEAGEAGPGIEEALRPLGLRVTTAPGTRKALGSIHELDYELVLWDSHLPNEEELSALRQLRRSCPELPVVVLADGAAPETAIELMKAGAHDFLAKPFGAVQLRSAVERALQARRLLCEASLIPSPGEAKGSPPRLVGRSPAMQEVYKLVGLVAARDEAVLLHGETGTGKELVATAIHQHSQRRDRPFLAINCAALSESLLESELFGHERGAFTGATQLCRGAFEQAHDGTLFLDEIGDMSFPLQAKILRVLQQGEIRRLGGDETVKVDVRLVAATNKVLEEALHEGTFREDLYYRLAVVSIRVPPLREHLEDLLELIEYFIDRHTPPGEPRPALDALALRTLQAYLWPGNVRELENIIRRALVVSRGPAILRKDVVVAEPVHPSGAATICASPRCQPSPAFGGPRVANGPDVAEDQFLGQQLDVALRQWLGQQHGSSPHAGATVATQLQGKLLRAALRCTEGNQRQAARLLGISRSTLREWIKKHGPASDSDSS